MNLPQKYSYLLAPDVPLVIREAIKFYGIREIVGSQHNPVILGWAKALGIQTLYKADETAWCGLAAAYILTRAKKFVPLKNWDLLRALKYKAFGIHVDEPMLGDVLIFGRAGGGHVGFYVGETPKTYLVLGGNQNNQFNIVEITKSRLVEARRPIYTSQPKSVRRIFFDSTGVISTNEA